MDRMTPLADLIFRRIADGTLFTEYLPGILKFCLSPSNIITYTMLGIVLLLSFSLPQKFVRLELTKIERDKAGMFSKVIIMFAGIVCSVIICILGIELLVSLSPSKIENKFIACMVMFSATLVLVRTFDHANLVSKSIAEVGIYKMVRRIAVASFIIGSIASVLTSLYQNNEAGRVVYNLLSCTALVYYFIEIYTFRRQITNCFTVEKSEEYSMSVQLIDFINEKFVYIALIEMLAVFVFNQSHITPIKIMVFCNMQDLFLSMAAMFIIQVITSYIVNIFLAKLAALENFSVLNRSLTTRKKNLIWICDVVVFAFYATMVAIVLDCLGIDIQKYIFHDALVVVALVIFGTVLVRNAFREFMEVSASRSSTKHKKKLLTFMPIISIIFDIMLGCISLTIILSELNVSIISMTAVIFAVGTMISNAAKDTLKGFIQGMVLILENNFSMGDFITINGISGVVTKISVRFLVLRSVDGDMHVIPYDIVKIVVNHSKEYFCHSENLLIAPNEDVEKAIRLLKDVIHSMKEDVEFKNIIYDEVNIIGVQAFSADGIRIVWALKTSSNAAGRLVHLEIYKRLLPIFRRENIKVPYRQEYVEYLRKTD